jgi:hypothetical protein
MAKIVTVLVLTALAMLVARLAYDAPVFDLQFGTATSLETAATVSAPLMYAGVRG